MASVVAMPDPVAPWTRFAAVLIHAQGVLVDAPAQSRAACSQGFLLRCMFAKVHLKLHVYCGINNR